MDDEEKEKWGRTLVQASLGAVTSPTPKGGNPKDWKISYLVTTELDLAMPEGLQRHLVETAKEAGAEVEVKTIRSGHFVQITHVKEVATWLVELCKRG